MHNARLTERTSFLGQVDVVPHASNRILRVWAQDVSETGMFLQTTQPFTVGETVSLRFDVETNEVHVRAAEVMWVRKFEPIAVDGKLPGVGLRFVSVDPPARAALRRLMPKEASDTIVDAAPTLNAQNTQNALPAPKITLPPLTASIIARATGGRGRHPQAGVSQIGISLAPFSLLPVISLPPDDPQLSSEARVFSGVPAGPRDVTMAPAKAKEKAKSPRITQPLFPEFEDDDLDNARDADSDRDDAAAGGNGVEASFAGWTFRREEPMPEAPREEPAPASLHQRFDDDAPTSVAVPRARSIIGNSSVIEDPSVLESTTALPQDFSMGSLPPAFNEGEMAVSQLALIEERARAPRPGKRRPAAKARRSAATAVAFLVAGCAAGAVVGIAQDRLKTRATPAVVAAADPRAEVITAPAPVLRSVAEAEADLAPPATTTTTATTATGATTATAATTPTTTKATLPEVTTKPAEPELAPLVATAKETRKEARARKALEQKMEKEKAKLAHEQEKPTLASTKKRASPEPLFASPGHLEVQLPEGGTVKRAFALSSPSRVVVDLIGARLPQKPIDVDEGGVMQLRFGHPDAKTERVVIIIAGGGDKPATPQASLDGDRLNVSWSW